MLDPEWPEPLPAASGASRTAKRLALAAARRDLLAAPARQVARERRVLLFHSRVCQAVRAGLAALGLDPARSHLLVENEARLAAELAALLPAENDPPPPAPSHPAPLGAHAEQWKANFRRQADRFREPSAAPPDLARESMFTLWAFVYARSPRHGLMPFGAEWVAAYDADLAAADDAAAPDEAGGAESDRYY